MAKQVLEDATVLWGRHDFSDYANQVAISIGIDTPECTNFGSAGWKEFMAGVARGGGQFSGFFRSDVPATTTSADLDLFNNLASAPFVVTKTNPVAEGDQAYALRGNRTTHRFGGALGELSMIDVDIAPDARVIRPVCIGMEASISASGNGSGYNLGAVSATQKLYGILFLGGVTGSPTLDVVIETAASDSWPGTDRITFTQETSATSRFQWSTASGAITGPWARAKWTYGGTGSFSTARVFVGIA